MLLRENFLMKTASEIPHVFERTIPEEISALNAAPFRVRLSSVEC